jgi:hypothetical protein
MNWWLFLFLFGSLDVGKSQSRRRVSVAIDKKHGLNPSKEQVLSNKLFHFHFISPSQALVPDIDIFAVAEWDIAKKLLVSAQHTAAHFRWFLNDDKLYRLFEHKLEWKRWINRIGLGDYVAASYSADLETVGSLKFPVIFKSTRLQFGAGVKIIYNAEDLKNELLKVPKEDMDTVFIEESLTGLGMSEMSAFGSVFNGTLLSMRCQFRTASPWSIDKAMKKNATHAVLLPRHNGSETHFTTRLPQGASPADAADAEAGTGADEDMDSVTGLFVRGKYVTWAEDVMLPCGQDLVQVVRTMFSRTSYTGAYCVDWKMDSLGRMKMMEVNARMCGTLQKPYADALTVAVLLPLSAAVLDHASAAAVAAGANASSAVPVVVRGQSESKTDDFTYYVKRSALLHSLNQRLVEVYRRILQEEARALSSGGGMFPAGWRDVQRFDPKLRSVPLNETYASFFEVGIF